MSNGLPGFERVVRDELHARLLRAGRRGIVPRELARGREGRDEEELLRALDQLRREGLAVEEDGRWVAVRHTPWVPGRVETLESGSALVRTGEDGEAGYFVSRQRLGGAVAGDLVLVERRPRRRRAGGRLPEAAVARLLQRPAARLVGTLEIDGADRRWLVPFDPRLDLEVEVEGGDELLEDQFAVVELERVDPRGHPRGRVTEVLGSPEAPGVDVLVVLRHFGIPDEFPPEVEAAARTFPDDPGDRDLSGREDLRGEVIVTIDGETARDFDDAISVEPLPGGAFRLGVHIADVSHYVGEGSPLDLEAYHRATSVYYPERAVPMLPEGLSNGLCSLRPGVPRLTVSAFLDLGPDGTVRGRRFAEAVIASARRLTYAQVRRLLEEPAPGDAADYGRILPMLARARQLMEILHRARMGRGSLDFDLPEGDVILDTDGYMVGVRPWERNAAHRIVEEFMIAANEAVAWELESRQCDGLFRVHDPPERGELEELRELLKGLGLRLKGSLENLHPSALQDVLRQAEGRPEEAFVTSVVLRSLQRAIYSPDCRGHYALASRYYTHFTSPIRRYPDLVVHRRLKALLRGEAEADAERTRLAERLPAIAEHSSAAERRAEQSERELLQWKKVRFLAHRTGERFPGRISGVQPFGLFVQLDGYLVDGLVPIRTLADDYYAYEMEGHRLVGQRSGRVFRLGDAVEAVLAGVDRRRRGLNLEIAGMPSPRTTGPRSPRRGTGAKGRRRS